jgi:glycosyltransferase involved in cell wall biosynthesis
VVFCEASSFGVPSLATRVGGIPGAIQEGVSGFTFPLTAGAGEWAARLRGLMADRTAYAALARSAFADYQQRTNWSAAGATVKRLLEEVVADPAAGRPGVRAASAPRSAPGSAAG